MRDQSPTTSPSKLLRGKIGDTFIQPHDIVTYPEPVNGMEGATIVRLVHLGFEMRVELMRANGQAIHAQITREEAKRLGLSEGQTVYLSLDRSKVFERVG